jgi:lipopolysaccharide/colanic/teichoic acid biosynthesis glycosyltransferase
MLSPLFALIAILIKLGSKGPVFYKDKRVGKDGKIFKLIKFRSMVVGAENIGLGRAVAMNDPRITRIGAFLRNYSLDELPQVINVLRGEMSLVGPRPTIMEQVKRYTSYQRRRLEVKPGITGWAQVNGRNLLSWKERIKLDVWYADHCSPLLDFFIVVKTFKVLFQPKGLYGKDGITPDL